MLDALKTFATRVGRATEHGGFWLGVGISVGLAVLSLVIGAAVVLSWSADQFKDHRSRSGFCAHRSSSSAKGLRPPRGLPPLLRRAARAKPALPVLRPGRRCALWRPAKSTHEDERRDAEASWRWIRVNHAIVGDVEFSRGS